MPLVNFILFSICLVVISAIITYTSYRRFRLRILKYSPLAVSFLGMVIFGLGPYIFNYAQGVSLGLLCLLLGIFFGVDFLSSFATLIYVRIKK